MPIVYRAANMVDAQLVMDELLAAGLQVRMSGSYLSGAIGELPPDQVISIWIDSDRQYDRARLVVKEFEASQRTGGQDEPCHQCKEMLSPQFGKCWNCGAWQAMGSGL